MRDPNISRSVPRTAARETRIPQLRPIRHMHANRLLTTMAFAAPLFRQHLSAGVMAGTGLTDELARQAASGVLSSAQRSTGMFHPAFRSNPTLLSAMVRISARTESFSRSVARRMTISADMLVTRGNARVNGNNSRD